MGNNLKGETITNLKHYLPIHFLESQLKTQISAEALIWLINT